MSIQAMAWAIEQQEVTQPNLRLLLLCLANYADAAGCNAFPAVLRLSRDSGLSESSIRRGLHKLETLGIIHKGNQSIAAAHINRSDRRPVVYDIRGVTMTPRSSNGVSKTPPRGVKNASTGCQALTPNPSLIRHITSEDFQKEKWKQLRARACRIGFRMPIGIETSEDFEKSLHTYETAKRSLG